MKYNIAEGPTGLTQVLYTLLEESKRDAQFAIQSHYILYQLAKQQSLLRIDPFFHISYYDLQGRPATVGVKEVISQFLREECGGQGHFEDVSGKEVLARNRSFLQADGEHGRVVLNTETTPTLSHALQKLEQAALIAQKAQASVTKAREHFGLFSSSDLEQNSKLSRNDLPHKPSKTSR